MAERPGPAHLQHRDSLPAVRASAGLDSRALLSDTRETTGAHQEDHEKESQDEDDQDAHRRRDRLRDRLDSLPRVRHHLGVRRRRRQGKVLQVRRRHLALLRDELVVHQPAAVRLDERQLSRRLPRYRRATTRAEGSHPCRGGLGELDDGDAGSTASKPGATLD